MRASRRTGGGVSGSSSMPRRAPWRASVRPHFNKRHKWVTDVVTCLCSCEGRSPDFFFVGLDPGLRRGTTDCRPSYLPARMDGHEASQHRFGASADKACVRDHLLECLRPREAADAFNQIAVAILVIGNE